MSVTPTPTLDTPMLRQYKQLKDQYQDAILFFRLGDFYEMFLDDATVASRILGLTLTGRGKDEKRIPMCGVPHHASDSYISKLVQKGYKVAICEQIGDPPDGPGLTKRDVVKVITPGTVLGHDSIDAKENNFLVAVNAIGSTDSFGISFVDISTGEFRLFQVPDDHHLRLHIDRLSPKEMLLDDRLSLDFGSSVMVNTTLMLDCDRSEESLCRHFAIKSLDAFGLQAYREAYPSASAILSYVVKTQKNHIPQLVRCLPFETDHLMNMDQHVVQHLELISPMHTNDKTGSLFWVLDDTKTAMGGRQLHHLIKSPSTDISLINTRLDAVEQLVNDLLSREEIRDILRHVYDLERLVSRIVTDHHNPRDLLALMRSLQSLSDLAGILSHLEGTLLEEYTHFFKAFDNKESAFYKIRQLIDASIKDPAPAIIREGGVIKTGYNQELDDLLVSFKDIRHWIASLESIEREKTGIPSLKVGFNKVFGYYFQISHTHQAKVPEHYIRKQTLTNAERYITPELKEKETLLLHGEEKQIELEVSLYNEIVSTLKEFIPDLQALANHVAMLDCLQAFSSIAQRFNYTRPVFVDNDSLCLLLKQSRHPVLDKQPGVQVISNDLSMSQDDHRFMLITGPNMAGKSTLMRQVALTVIMAQMGCFVPAESATLSIVDKLFTRIGALDNLYAGQSTFMVEMLETATILHNATAQSLILLDEIGRGTATYDGLSIAGAVADYIHTKIKARTLFATHYHELTTLSKQFPAFNNVSMSIEEENGQLAFTYQLKEGPADKSYGIHVAKMAGLPKPVIERASELLTRFEQQGLEHTSRQLSLF